MTPKEVLEVLLFSFEAAADAFPRFLIAYAEPHMAGDGTTAWLVWHVEDLEDPPAQALELSFPPSELVTALERSNMCDSFAFLLEEEADKKMREYFGGDARWIITMPKPELLLAFRNGARIFDVPGHSVLVVRTSEGDDQLIMDGTAVQFGWKREEWLLPAHDYINTRLGGQGELAGRMAWASETERKATYDAMKGRNEGFWAVVHHRMQQLFDELQWDDLGKMTREKRVEAVKKQAELKFDGAWDEASELWG
jgi:hypothetical protein